jgi:N-acyl-D-aspartate/D-glutamate deacylase
MRFLAMAVMACAAFAQDYDVAIAIGRVRDPASNLDAARNVGTRGGKIAAVSASPLSATGAPIASALSRERL